MKKKTIAFDAEELVRRVEEVRDAVKGRRKFTLRTIKLTKSVPTLTPKDAARIRVRLRD